MTETKTAVLKLIKENKDVLFGKFSPNITHEKKIEKWKVVAADAQKRGIIDKNKDWKYCRDVVWQNWKKRTIAKLQKRNQTDSRDGKKYKDEETDKIILEIIGRDTPNVEQLFLVESWETTKIENDNSITTNINLSKLHKPQKKKKRKEIQENEKQFEKCEKSELENIILKKKFELFQREIHLKDIAIYEKEKELGLPKSEFTKKFYLCTSKKL